VHRVFTCHPMSERRVRPVRENNGALSVNVTRIANSRIALLGVLWAFGLFAVFLAPAPVKITQEKLAIYQAKLDEAQGITRGLALAEQELMDAQLHLNEVAVWFWRFRPEARKEVEGRKPAVEAAKIKVRALHKERSSMLSDAKRALGLWSDAGLEESRQLLWSSFYSGKVFAQRQTFWDSIFAIFDSREKAWYVLLFELLVTAIINYTLGAVLSVVSFVISLPSLISTFQPSWPSAIAFFSVGVLASISLILAYIAVLFAAGTAVVFTTSSFLHSYESLRLTSERQRPYIRSRQHYD
jgi:hypothetical protein